MKTHTHIFHVLSFHFYLSISLLLTSTFFQSFKRLHYHGMHTILLHFPNKLAENLLSLIAIHIKSQFLCSILFFFACFYFDVHIDFSTHSMWNAEIPMHLCYNKKNLFLKIKIIARWKKTHVMPNRKMKIKWRSTKVKLRLKRVSETVKLYKLMYNLFYKYTCRRYLNCLVIYNFIVGCKKNV